MPNDFLEKTVETLIFENKRDIERYGLCKFRSTVFRQLILPSGKKLDIFAFDLVDGHIYIDIYELKLECINTDAVAQAYNYLVEIADLIKGDFKSYDFHIIMIGKRYEPIPIFEKMNFPYSVYTYDYQIDGMRFNLRQKVKRQYQFNENFSLGLWAFGLGEVHYAGGQPNTVNLANVYREHSRKHPTFDAELKKTKQAIVNPKVVEHVVKEVFVPIIKSPPTVKTVIFPEQPGWSSEFLAGIPHTDMLEDFDIDDSDYEPDTADFEPEVEGENETPAYTLDVEDRHLQIQALIEKINLEGE